ncbi:opioid-binding protein/cell adhesion molecule homolog [Engraulis encrasicolus]|uniref:opioid-binding protein/cell adhesion molecule homolog n=1 Tax=Engraulis encrasicolus TaxID=184585 RepID=UPI002FD35B5F
MLSYVALPAVLSLRGSMWRSRPSPKSRLAFTSAYPRTTSLRLMSGSVSYPPVISRARNTLSAVGQKGTLQCGASAVPFADFEWYKEDRKVLIGVNGLKIECKGKQSMLTFFNVTEEDYGNYTCIAMNALGVTNASLILCDMVTWHNNRIYYKKTNSKDVCLHVR